MAESLNIAEMEDTKESDTIEWDKLLQRAVREYCGRPRARVSRSIDTAAEKVIFLAIVFGDARSINPRGAVEVGKNLVDVNEKVYSNHEGVDGGDNTTVTITNTVRSTETHNYQETVTRVFSGASTLTWDCSSDCLVLDYLMLGSPRA